MKGRCCSSRLAGGVSPAETKMKIGGYRGVILLGEIGRHVRIPAGGSERIDDNFTTVLTARNVSQIAHLLRIETLQKAPCQVKRYLAAAKFYFDSSHQNIRRPQGDLRSGFHHGSRLRWGRRRLSPSGGRRVDPWPPPLCIWQDPSPRDLQPLKTQPSLLGC